MHQTSRSFNWPKPIWQFPFPLFDLTIFFLFSLPVFSQIINITYYRLDKSVNLKSERGQKKNSSNCEDGKLFFANYPSYLCLLLLFLMIYQYHDVLLLLSIISLINFYSLTYLFYCAATNPTNKNPIPYSNCSNKPQTSIFGNFDENMLFVDLFISLGKLFRYYFQ